jgi:hypothetical protein
MNSPVESPVLAPVKPTARSRLTNHADLLPGIDGRSVVARRYRDLCSALIADGGGLDRCSEAKIQLIRRFAAASVLAEQLEAKIANGEPIDIGEHTALASTLVRLVQRIGIDRAMKVVVPELRDYIEARAE